MLYSTQIQMITYRQSDRSSPMTALLPQPLDGWNGRSAVPGLYESTRLEAVASVRQLFRVETDRGVQGSTERPDGIYCVGLIAELP